MSGVAAVSRWAMARYVASASSVPLWRALLWPRWRLRLWYWTIRGEEGAA